LAFIIMNSKTKVKEAILLVNRKEDFMAIDTEKLSGAESLRKTRTYGKVRCHNPSCMGRLQPRSGDDYVKEDWMLIYFLTIQRKALTHWARKIRSWSALVS